MRSRLTGVFLVLALQCCAQDIFDAARHGDTMRIAAMMARDRDTLEAVNPAGFTPLILATYHAQEATVAWLLRHGAQVNKPSPEGPALLGACFKGNEKIAALLLSAGADPNGTNQDGISALMFAVMVNSVSLCELLLRFGASKEQKDLQGRRAIEYCTPVTVPAIRELLKS